MPQLLALFADLSAYLKSPEFLANARHPAHPTAFSRNRKLPLAVLMAFMLSAMRKSIQVELDTYFAHLSQQAQLMRVVSEQAFSQARSKLSLIAIPLLNTWLVSRAEHYGFVKRWGGLRLVAADASTVRFGIRASRVTNAALADQILFAMFLPGVELILAASLHAIKECGERQMLFQHLDLLGPSDLLLLDRGYPAAWLVAVLIERQIPFCMRVEKSGNSGYTCVRNFLRSGLSEQLVMMRAPNRPDARDYECKRVPHQVRLVRQMAPNGQLRVLMTSLLDTAAFPASSFSNLYHQRWRIEEAFKRLKDRLNIEHVSGLSQQAVVQDVSAKIVADNLQALTALTAHAHAELDIVNRINHGYAHSVLKPLWPSLLSLGRKVKKLLKNALDLIGGQNYRHRENVSKTRKAKSKSYKHLTQKPC